MYRKAYTFASKLCFSRSRYSAWRKSCRFLLNIGLVMPVQIPSKAFAEFDRNKSDWEEIRSR